MKLYALPTKIKIQSRQATQRKIGNRTTEQLLLGRFIFFHRVVGVFSYSRYFGHLKLSFCNLNNLNTLIFVSSTYRVYFIIFFLKSAGFSIKKEPFPHEKRNGLLFILFSEFFSSHNCHFSLKSK